jgi:heme ABC exporter ATP-binding subunit CcmA
MESVVKLSGLRRDYGDRPVLRDVSLELGRGETLVVVGPNGAGKSTLLRILATLLRPTAGEAEVLGAELPRQAYRARGRIGYVGHQPLLYRELSVRENLEFNARLHRIEHRRGRIRELLEASGLARRGDELVRNLSAGMLQRASICRALLAEPELLLLDEPTSHLDSAGAEIATSLVGPAEGRSRVIVSHEVDSALLIADQVLALHADGRLAYCGAAEGLAAAEVREIYSGAVA